MSVQEVLIATFKHNGEEKVALIHKPWYFNAFSKSRLQLQSLARHPSQILLQFSNQDAFWPSWGTALISSLGVPMRLNVTSMVFKANMFCSHAWNQYQYYCTRQWRKLRKEETHRTVQLLWCMDCRTTGPRRGWGSEPLSLSLSRYLSAFYLFIDLSNYLCLFLSFSLSLSFSLALCHALCICLSVYLST